jgi:hypothetical protein
MSSSSHDGRWHCDIKLRRDYCDATGATLPESSEVVFASLEGAEGQRQLVHYIKAAQRALLNPGQPPEGYVAVARAEAGGDHSDAEVGFLSVCAGVDMGRRHWLSLVANAFTSQQAGTWQHSQCMQHVTVFAALSAVATPDIMQPTMSRRQGCQVTSRSCCCHPFAASSQLADLMYCTKLG